MSRNIEKRIINNSIATVIGKNNQIFRYYMQKLKRVYINTPIIVEFVYPGREPATRIEQRRHYLRSINYKMKRI